MTTTQQLVHGRPHWSGSVRRESEQHRRSACVHPDLNDELTEDAQAMYVDEGHFCLESLTQVSLAMFWAADSQQ